MYRIQGDEMNHKYRKKPVIIEAFQMTKERRLNNVDWPFWLHEAWNREVSELGSFFCEKGVEGGFLSIKTLEGVMVINWGDWIIRGVKGELYPCKPDIFEATYEKVEEDYINPALEYRP